MIAWFDKKIREARTVGCGCCSTGYNTEQKEDIVWSLRDNIRVAKEVCKFFGISFDNFCNGIKTEDECKRHEFHNFSSYKVCGICGRFVSLKARAKKGN